MSTSTEETGSAEDDPRAVSVDAIVLSDPVVLVLAEGDTPAAVNNARGHLFESFVARLLHIYGYNHPSTTHVNVTREGIELDVTAVHDLTGQAAIAECKAYTSPVSAGMLGTFHSKLITTRYQTPDAHGYFVALPRLTTNGQEQADVITGHDTMFKVLTAHSVVDLLRSRQTIVDCPVPGLLISDPAVVITEYGVHAACLELDRVSRLPSRVLVWAPRDPVPTRVLDALLAR